jgi:hypothetical protein
VSLRNTSFKNSKSEIEIPKSEIFYREGAGGAGGAGGGAKCLGGAQPALKAKYIAASTIIAVIFFIAVVFYSNNNNQL